MITLEEASANVRNKRDFYNGLYLKNYHLPTYNSTIIKQDCASDYYCCCCLKQVQSIFAYFFFHLMMPSFYVIFKSSANLTFAQSKRSINWQENKPQHLLKVSIKYLKLYLKRTCYGHMAMLDMIDS